MSASSLLVIGATSDIARAAAREFAAHGHAIVLAARDGRRVRRDAADITHRHGVEVRCLELDVLDYASYPRFFEQLRPLPDVTLCAVGLLGDQERAQSDLAAGRLVMESNYVGPASILAEVANRYQRAGQGTIIGISSVAGDRGRARNYVYGSAKAGFTAYLSGLRNRMHRHGVRVLTVKPGFVATRMTAGLDLPPLLTARPEQTARDIYRAYARGSDVVYTRRIWRWVMLPIRALPERIFKTTDL